MATIKLRLLIKNIIKYPIFSQIEIKYSKRQLT